MIDSLHSGLPREIARDAPEMEQSSLLEEFVTNGYITLHPTLDQDIHSKIFQQSSAYFVDEDTLGNNIFPEIKELDLIFNSTEVTSSLECLLGPNYLMHTHRRCHDSHPGRSTQALHKDTYKGYHYHARHRIYWVMAMYYPQDTTFEIGPTAMSPGTQYYRGDNNGASASSSIVKNVWNSTEIKLVCKAGSVVIMHYDLWHKGCANVSENSLRFMFKFQFFRTQAPEPTLSQCSLQWLETVQSKDHLNWTQTIFPFKRKEKFDYLSDEMTKYSELVSLIIETVDVSGFAKEDYIADNSRVKSEILKQIFSQIDNWVREDESFHILKKDIQEKVTCYVNKLATNILIDNFIQHRYHIWEDVWCWLHGILFTGIKDENILVNEGIGLSKQLYHDNESIRVCASYRLGSILSNEAHQIIFDALTKGNTQQRRTASHGLVKAMSLTDTESGIISSVSIQTIETTLTIITNGLGLSSQCFDQVSGSDIVIDWKEDDFDHELSKDICSHSQIVFCCLLSLSELNPLHIPVDLAKSCVKVFLNIASSTQMESVRILAIQCLENYGYLDLDSSFAVLTRVSKDHTVKSVRYSASFSLLQIVRQNLQSTNVLILKYREVLFQAFNDSNRYVQSYSFIILMSSYNLEILERVSKDYGDKYKLPLIDYTLSVNQNCDNFMKWWRCPITNVNNGLW